MKNIHLIAIGGAIMHNLAIALKKKGYTITGSDDAIFDPAETHLRHAGLLPETGWNADAVHGGIDGVIVGMHARADNPELIRAGELGIPVLSFPEFVAKESAGKKRVVIAGSHGKTTTTAMIMYALRKAGLDFDYLVGSSIEGFELSVKLSEAPLIIIEGDEYLSSPLDLKSKFLWYYPHISVITGIAYDHINVFPTFASYLETFRIFINQHGNEDRIFWFKEDEHLQEMLKNAGKNETAYTTPDYKMMDNRIYYVWEGKDYPLSVIGEHNLQNLESAALVCEALGIKRPDFLHYIADFSGAGRRMEKIYEKEGQVVFRDFAHSPSKLKATVDAVKKTYSTRPLTAVFELHTFSSLNRDFLPYYKETMKAADQAIVFYDKHVFEHKRMEVLSDDFVKNCFGEVHIITDKSLLEKEVDTAFEAGNNLLLMSSGKFSEARFSYEN